MIDKYHVSFFLQKTYNTKSTEAQIRMRVRWQSNLFQVNTGYTIDPKKWANGEVKKNAFNKDGISRHVINERLSNMESIVDTFFASIRAKYDRFPTLSEVKDRFRPKNTKPKDVHNLLNEFLNENVNIWSSSTFAKFRTIQKHLFGFNPKLTPNDFTVNTIDKLRDYLLDLGLRNTVVKKEWKNVLWFLRWCEKKGLISNLEWKDYKMNLKTTPHEIIYLEWEELKRLYEYVFPTNKEYLANARDFFCLGCYTGLRFSDISNLEWSNIFSDRIVLTTLKDSDRLTIPLTNQAKEILARHRNSDKPFDISSQKLNSYIKQACAAVGIDEAVKISYYKGAKLITETKLKYELISSHTGRRTFICNALQMGINPSIIMLITGHSDYKAMQPYINATDKAKIKAMELFNK